MSRLADDFVIGATPAEATNACRGAIARFGWKVASEGANEIAISVPMMGTNWPSKLSVRFASAGVGGTRITLDGKTGGANQERHLGKVIAAMRAALEQPGPAARFGEATAVERPDAPEQPAAPPPQAMYGPVPRAGYQLPIAFDLPQPKPFLTARAFALIVIVAVAAVALACAAPRRGRAAASGRFRGHGPLRARPHAHLRVPIGRGASGKNGGEDADSGAVLDSGRNSKHLKHAHAVGVGVQLYVHPFAVQVRVLLGLHRRFADHDLRTVALVIPEPGRCRPSKNETPPPISADLDALHPAVDRRTAS
jgi:hypothetical protein